MLQPLVDTWRTWNTLLCMHPVCAAEIHSPMSGRQTSYLHCAATSRCVCTLAPRIWLECGDMWSATTSLKLFPSVCFQCVVHEWCTHDQEDACIFRTIPVMVAQHTTQNSIHVRSLEWKTPMLCTLSVSVGPPTLHVHHPLVQVLSIQYLQPPDQCTVKAGQEESSLHIQWFPKDCYRKCVMHVPVTQFRVLLL